MFLTQLNLKIFNDFCFIILLGLFSTAPDGNCRVGGYLSPQGPLRTSKSVPEGLAHPDHYINDQNPHQFCHAQDFFQQQHQQQTEFLQYPQQRARTTPRRCRDVTVIEQITTSV